MTDAGIDNWKAILAAATRVEVFPGDVSDERGSGAEPTVAVTEADDIRDLIERLQVKKLVKPPDRTFGQATFRLFGPEGELATVVLHDGAVLRWDRWKDEGTLERGHRIVAWLARRGISISAQVAARLKEQRRQKDQELQTWVDAIPVSLRELTPHIFASGAAGQIAPRLVEEAEELVTRQLPDETERCATLLLWCGSGTGRLTGHPPHETFPDELLKRISVAAVLQTVTARSSAAVSSGAARHLAHPRARTRQELAQADRVALQELITAAAQAGREDLAEGVRRRLG